MFPPEIQRKILDFPTQCPEGTDRDIDPFKQFFRALPPTATEPRAKPLPNSKKDGYSEVYRNIYSPQNLATTYHPEISTNYEVFLRTARQFPNNDFLGQREYEPATKTWSDYKFISYRQAQKDAYDLAAGIAFAVNKQTGFSTKEGYIVSMYMPNCPRWIVTDIAAQSQSLPSVCLYDTLGADTSEYILNFCKAPVAVSSLANIHKLLTLKLPHLKVIVSSEEFDTPSDKPGAPLASTLKSWAALHGIDLYSFKEILEVGRSNPIAERPPRPDDIYAINFTSGTTGRPKGAILSHSNILAGAVGLRGMVPLTAEDIGVHSFSFLPLAHIYERVMTCAYISYACKFSYPHGDVTQLMDDLFMAKPDIVNMVPRLLNRIAASLQAATIEAPGITGAISRRAFAGKFERLQTTGSPNHPFWDPVWSNKIAKKLGFENIKYIVSGSAPLAAETLQFLRCVLGAEVLQGYGLTESMGGCCFGVPNERDAGHVGATGLATEFKLRDVPDLNYFSSDKPHPRGELMLRGPQIFKGYYNNPEKTDEALDDEGWFYTGDIAKFDDLGRAHIIDRVKNFFKLAQGEYVAAEKIENVYTSHTVLLTQIFVYGNSHENFLVALCGLNPESFAPWVSKFLGQTHSSSDLVALRKLAKDPKVVRAFLNTLNSSITPGLLQGFEFVKNLRLAIEPMTMDNGCLTPTMKVVRNVTVKLYQNEFDEMYKEGAIGKDGARL